MNGVTSFTYCEPYAADEIVVWAGPLTGSLADRKIVWKTSGAPPIVDGQSVTYGVPPIGFQNLEPPSSIDLLESHYAIEFAGGDGSSRIWSFDGSNLVDGKSLRWDGTIASSPCPE